MYFYTDAKFGSDSWAANLCYKQGEEKLFTAAADISNVLTTYKTDLEFSDYCRRIHYSFPDGWPNNPNLFAETIRQAEEEANTKAAQVAQPIFKRFSQWLTKKL